MTHVKRSPDQGPWRSGSDVADPQISAGRFPGSGTATRTPKRLFVHERSRPRHHCLPGTLGRGLACARTAL